MTKYVFAQTWSKNVAWLWGPYCLGDGTVCVDVVYHASHAAALSRRVGVEGGGWSVTVDFKHGDDEAGGHAAPPGK